MSANTRIHRERLGVSASLYASCVTVPEYTVTRKRMKTTRLRVTPPHGEVLVSAPHWVSEKAIHDFVVQRADWIRDAQARIALAPPRIEAGPEADRLRVELRERAVPLMAYWTDRMELDPPTLGIRRMTSRWGTCHVQKRHVTLALELATRPDELLEYVIVHELAHLYVPNHGPEFKALMTRYLPEWRRLRAELHGR